MSKPELRQYLASLSFSEKIKILEKLRRRSLAIAASRAKLKSADSEKIMSREEKDPTV